MLIEFSERHSLKIINTVFKKKEKYRWTWLESQGTTRYQIDSVLMSDPLNYLPPNRVRTDSVDRLL